MVTEPSSRETPESLSKLISLDKYVCDDAWQIWIERNQAKLERWIYNISEYYGVVEFEEDILWETIAALNSSLRKGTYNPEKAGLPTYSARIARHIAIDYAKEKYPKTKSSDGSEKRFTFIAMQDLSDDVKDTSTQSPEDVDGRIDTPTKSENSSQTDMVPSELKEANLTPEEWQILNLKFVHEMSEKEIAIKLRISYEKTRQIISRVLRRCRKLKEKREKH